MSGNAAPAVLAGLQAATFILQQIALHQAGELTDEELQERWNAMGVDVDRANRLWEESLRLSQAKPTA